MGREPLSHTPEPVYGLDERRAEGPLLAQGAFVLPAAPGYWNRGLLAARMPSRNLRAST
jgi:hypothetical protein